ncbi:hypothetical protein [Amycolatopsis granulosa]|uniref:hypothetical protein n=1 Tax=Amycolatopsis granulosa TaxID=185684 RepID=UPI00141DD5C8|nr:hypothetical protein [Amycolatopsis granulosa]NIH87758.1 hypothetical protein [Amycolatopsis granulosa]
MPEPAQLAERTTAVPLLGAAHLAGLRRHLRELLDGERPDAAERALLVVDTLAGLACRHAQPPFAVRLRHRPGARLRADIRELRCRALPGHASLRLPLHVLDRLARMWCVDLHGHHGVLTAEVDLSR